jgi:hypothetical protein
MTMNYIEDQMKELMDRSRRIETKLTRMINGEVDKGVTIIDYRLAHSGDWQLELRSQSITLAQIVNILETEGVPQGDRVAVFDNDRYMLTVAV